MPHLKLCQITLSNSRDCQQPVPSDFPMDICEMHALMTTAVVLERGGAVAKRLIGMYDHVPRVTPKDAKKAKPVIVRGKSSVVYYLRFGDRVKIGTTTNLRSRLAAIPHDELLAVEPGNHAIEHMRHLQFADFRVTGEWFRNSPDVADHYKYMRSVYGEPMSAFQKWRNEPAA